MPAIPPGLDPRDRLIESLRSELAETKRQLEDAYSSVETTQVYLDAESSLAEARKALEEAAGKVERLFAHGAPHTIDIIVRKDAVERRYEGDWLKAYRIRPALFPSPEPEVGG